MRNRYVVVPPPPKASSAEDCEVLEQIPNIGPSLAADLRRIGIEHPAELSVRDPFALYLMLCFKTGQRHDNCVLDAFMAACDFMRGKPAAPWWHYTKLRKQRYTLALRNLFGDDGHDLPTSQAVEEAIAQWAPCGWIYPDTAPAAGLGPERGAQRAAPRAPVPVPTGCITIH